MKTIPHGAWHQLHAEEALRLLEVDLRTGLDDGEVRRRQETFGLNRFAPRAGTPAWRRLAEQFNQPLVYLLLVAVVITALLGEWVDTGVIAGVVFANAVVGFLQETKAANAIASLSRLVATGATVRRGGRKQRVPSEELVPGDVVVLSPGDRVGADLRLFLLKDLQVDESALTGESVPVLKHPDPLALDTVLADRKNLAFAGTLVTAGHGEGVVWATGDKTETGRIAWLIAETVHPSSPLGEKIARFSRLLMWVILGLAAATFTLGVVRGEPVVAMFMAAVALSVGAIPEGLPTAVTVVLAIGVARMARRHAIIRQLPAVEALGSTTVICTDKTGTLTQNEMTVREIYAGGKVYDVTGVGHAAPGAICRDGSPVDVAGLPALAECLRAGVLCNDAQFLRAGGRVSVQGDPTEIALLVAGDKGGLIHADTHRASPLVDTIPFESAHMFRATLHESRASRVIYKVGAAERVLERCADTLDAQGHPTSIDREAVRQAVADMAGRGLRVLALARRHVPSSHPRLVHGHVADGLTLLGLQGMLDPPRPEVPAAVRHCLKAGIAVKMITGDHLITARTIATQVGLVGGDAPGGPAALSGRDLDKLSPVDLPEVAERTMVFARVTPEQKLRLVCALQSRGHVVAMTGDGVNDAPALKQADIGVAMGIGGTDVAKSAAAMVLADDNFASIEAAVEEGRGVYDNLTKFILWIIPTNLGEALLLITAVVAGLPLPVLPLQLLWINLTDTLLGLPLAFEPKDGNVMRRPPRNPGQPLLTRPLLMRSGLVALAMLAGALWLFAWEMSRAGSTLPAARTAVVNVIVLVETVYLFNCRSLNRGCFSAGFFSNPWAFAGAFAMLGAQLLFTYAPVMNRLLHSAPLSGGCWLRIAGIAGAVFILVELEKWLRYGRGRGDHALPE
jgi:cation-transporting ATPase F